MRSFTPREIKKFYEEVTDPLVEGAHKLLTRGGEFSDLFIPMHLNQGGFTGSRSVDRAFEFYRNPNNGHMILWEAVLGAPLMPSSAFLYPNLEGTQYIERIGLRHPVKNPDLYGFDVKSHYDTPQAPEHLELVNTLQGLTHRLSEYQRVGIHKRNLSDKVFAELTGSTFENNIFKGVRLENTYFLRRDSANDLFFRGLATDQSGRRQFEALKKLQGILNRESNLE